MSQVTVELVEGMVVGFKYGEFHRAGVVERVWVAKNGENCAIVRLTYDGNASPTMFFDKLPENERPAKTFHISKMSEVTIY